MAQFTETTRKLAITTDSGRQTSTGKTIWSSQTLPALALDATLDAIGAMGDAYETLLAKRVGQFKVTRTDICVKNA